VGTDGPATPAIQRATEAREIGGILTQPLLLFCHAFSNLQKTGINIDDLTHSMASDVSTVANNWDGFWPSTDTKDTKAAVEQNSTRYLPVDSSDQQ